MLYNYIHVHEYGKYIFLIFVVKNKNIMEHQQHKTSLSSIVALIDKNIDMKYTVIDIDLGIVEITEGPSSPFRVVVDVEKQTVTRVFAKEILGSCYREGKYKNGCPDSKRIASEILCIPMSDYWKVLDVFNNLALIHYVDDQINNEINKLRGVIVDLKNKVVVCSSYGATPIEESVTVDEVLSTPSFSGGRITIQRGYEGVVIRAFKYKGKVFFSTFKRIHPLGAKWIKSDNFLQIYKRSGGPTGDELFDPKMEYSNMCYTFIVVDSMLCFGTRENITSSYVVYIGCDKASNWETIITDGSVEIEQFYKPSDKVRVSKELSIEEANTFLDSGYHCDENKTTSNDVIQQPGESVIITNYINDKVECSVRVVSPSYMWRIRMRNNTQNIKRRFYSLLKQENDITFREFCRDYICCDNYSKSELKEILPSLCLPRHMISNKEFSNRKFVRKQLLVNYLISLPLTEQKNYVGLLEEIDEDRQIVIQNLKKIVVMETGAREASIKEFINDPLRRVTDIIRQSFFTATKKWEMRNCVGNFNALLEDSIEYLVNRENLPSLYKISVACRRMNLGLKNESVESQN